MNRILTTEIMEGFRQYLHREEKSRATIEKYLRDVRAFFAFAGREEVTKELVVAWKESLIAAKYAPRSVNSMLASLGSLLRFLGWEDCKVKSLKIQRQIYCSEDRELTQAEYQRLLKAAEEQPQLQLIMETIQSSGIRISELRFFTVEAVRAGEVHVNNKGKNRSILLQHSLMKKLLAWVKKSGISHGTIFISKNGRPLNRSNIWAQMKRLCRAAGVKVSKVFPHNLRKLFARIHYKTYKDISRLADVLGHTNINTTRIYIMTSGKEHRRQLERLKLVQ